MHNGPQYPEGTHRKGKYEVRHEYDRSAFCYEQRYKTIQKEKYRIMIDSPLHGKILDLGCGTGLLSEHVKKAIYGVDISYEMLKKAQRRERVVQADMDFLPFKDAVFDFVLSFTSLQNLPSTDLIFEEVKRVLKPGNPFIFTVLKKELPPLESVKAHFTIERIQDCGEDVGFICH